MGLACCSHEVIVGTCAQSHGISPADNVVKECGEEAGIPAEIARTAT